MNNKFKKIMHQTHNNYNTGVTLISLVIAVIVIIILCGITYTVVLGENGIINKTKQTKEEVEIAEKRQEVELVIQELLIDNKGKVDDILPQHIADKLNLNEQRNIIADPEDTFPTYIVYPPEATKINKQIRIQVLKDLTIGKGEISEEPILVEKYNISYELNGGVNSSENPYQYTYGKSVSLKPATKQGFSFMGWYTDSNYTNQISVISKEERKDITLYALWSQNVYTVIIYHYDAETNQKLSEERIISSILGIQYNAKPLLLQDGETQEDGREYLNNKKYYVSKVEGNQQGAYKEETQEVKFFYGVNKYNITVILGEGGTATNTIESVKYGEDAVNQIVITPDDGNKVSNITVNDVKFTDYQEDYDTKVVTLPIFKTIIKDKTVNVTFEQMSRIVKIVSVPEGYENLIGTEYTSLKKAIEAAPEGAIIQLLDNVINETVKIDKDNITIDLNGKTIQNTGDAITVEQGKVNIINTSEEQGNIISTSGVGIHVKENAIVEFGQNDGIVNINNIVTQGATQGIKVEGIFNFYDGQIIGQKAIEGNINEIPPLYNVAINEENGNQIAKLEILADAEALIGNKTFLLLEDAIDYANTSINTDGSQVEIKVVKDIQKTTSIQIDSSKNILLDLNGYVVGFVNLDTGINNNGKLEIIDRKEQIVEGKPGLISANSGGIDTGINLSGNYKIETDIRVDRNSNNFIWGAGDGEYNSSIDQYNRLSYYTNGYYRSSSKALELGKIYNISEEHKNGVMTGFVNGEEYLTRSAPNNSSNSNNIQVFGGNSSYTSGNITMYSFKIYKEDVLVLDLVPVEKGQTIDGNTAQRNGFYDYVGKTFKYADYIYEKQIIRTSTGKITASSKNSIVNNEGAQLKITSGTIDNTNTSGTAASLSSVIYNKSDLDINGGNLLTYNNFSTVIYNYSGNITMQSGKIQNTTKYYTIYGETQGNIQINGGEIISQQYGIYTRGTTNLEINGGIIKSYIEFLQNTNTYINNVNFIGTITHSSNGMLNIKDGIFHSGSGTVIYTSNRGGKVEISNGSFVNYNENIFVSYLNDLKITGGNFILSNDTSCNITISDNTTNVEISGANIKSKSNGLGINSAKQVTIKNTNIETTGTRGGYSYGIKNTSSSAILNIQEGVKITSENGIALYNESKSTINIGNKDGVFDDENIQIEGATYGLYNYSSGQVNYYDGKIIGANGQSIYGAIEDIETDYTIVKNIENEKEVAIQDKVSSFKVIQTNVEYSNLQDAIDSIQTGDVNIQVLNNTYIPGNTSIVIQSNKNIIIDLNEKQLEFGKAEAIINEGKLEITDLSESKTGTMLALGGNLILNKQDAKLDISNVNIKSGIDYINIIENKGELNTREVIIYAEYRSNRAINNSDFGTLNMIGGIIYNPNSSYAIYTQSTGNININGTTITGKDVYNGIYSNGTENIELINCDITAVNAIVNNGESNITINGGNINGNIKNKKGNITIDNGAILNSTARAITNESTGNIIFKNGIINSNVGIQNDGTGTVKVEGGTINSTGYSNYGGIYNSSTGNIIITGGKIVSTTSSGVCNYSTGTVTIGIKDGDVSQEEPNIIGKTHGIYNYTTGIVNYYDGSITGATNQSIYGNINEVEQEYDIVKTTDTSLKTETAQLKSIPIIINTTTNTEYYNIKDAISDIQEHGNLQLLRNATILSTVDTIIINNDKNVVLDLNGYTLSVGKEDLIQNLGILEIIDNSTEKTGCINSSASNLIVNEKDAILNLNEFKLACVKDSTTIIQNKGELNVNQANISSSNESVTVINNIEDGTIVFNNGTITMTGNQSIGISNESTKDVTIKDGIITCTYSSYGSGTGIAIQNNSTSEINIEGGTISGSRYGVNNILGNLNISGGTIKTAASYAKAIQNASTGTINITGGNIIDENSYGNSIYNSSTGKVMMADGIITGATKAINNYGTGTIEITGGSITAKEEAIYNNSTGIITLGSKDNIINIQEPLISSSKYGIYNPKGTFKFYDGTIVAQENKGIYGEVIDIEEGYSIIKSINSTNSTETLTLQDVVTIKIVETAEEFNNIQDAIDAAENGQTIKLVNNLSTINTTDSIFVGNDKNIVLDLNGYTMNFGNNDSIKNLGTLTIIDSSENKTGYIYNCVGNIITNEENAQLYLLEGTIEGARDSTNIIINKGILEIDGFKLQSSYDNTIISNVNSGKLTFKSGIISNIKNVVINNSSTQDMLISGGYIYGTVKNTALCNINITGGEIQTERTNIIDNTLGNINIDGGKIYSSSNIDGITNKTGNVNITNGIISTNGVAIRNDLGGNTNIIGGDITGAIYNYGIGDITIKGGDIKTRSYNAIHNISTGNVLMSGGTIIADYAVGIYNTKGNVTIEGGTITATKEGIYNYSTGIITIGNNDGNVNTQEPLITSSTYGIHNLNGTLNIYDGKIIGSTIAINGNTNDIPTNYQVKYLEENTIATLELIVTMNKIASIGNTYYDTIQTAINSSSDGDTIDIWSHCAISDKIVIPEGKTLTINLQNHIISYTGEEYAIQNNGILYVVDNALDEQTQETYSKIENTSGTAIQNNGTLVIGVNDGTINTFIPKIVGTIVGIENNGAIEFYDGQIIGDETITGTTVITIPEGYVLKQEQINNQKVLTLLEN